MKAISRVNTVVTDLGSEIVFWWFPGVCSAGGDVVEETPVAMHGCRHTCSVPVVLLHVHLRFWCPLRLQPEVVHCLWAVRRRAIVLGL